MSSQPLLTSAIIPKTFNIRFGFERLLWQRKIGQGASALKWPFLEELVGLLSGTERSFI
jgi:hypothetical protein